MKVLLINQTFYPDTASSAQHLTDLAVALKRKNCKVTVLASRRDYTNPSRVHSKFEIYDGIEIHRLFSLGWGRGGKYGRMADAAFLNAAFAVHLLFLPRFDVIVALTSPPLVAWAAAIFARLRKGRLVYWVMDLNPDEAVAAGWIRSGSFQAKVLSAALRYVLRSSQEVAALDSFMKQRILEKEPLARDRVSVIPPWPHEEALAAVNHSKNIFRTKQGWMGKFVVMYSGNHSLCHPLDTVLGAARRLQSEDTVIFAFVGGGARVQEVLDFKERHELKNIVHLPYVPREDLHYSLSAADLHVVAMGDEYVGIVHPCKIYNILQIGRPVVYIGPAKSHIGEMIENMPHTYHVDHGQEEQLAECIRRVRETAAEDGEAATYLPEKFSKEVLLSKLTEIILKTEKNAKKTDSNL